MKYAQKPWFKVSTKQTKLGTVHVFLDSVELLFTALLIYTVELYICKTELQCVEYL